MSKREGSDYMESSGRSDPSSLGPNLQPLDLSRDVEGLWMSTERCFLHVAVCVWVVFWFLRRPGKLSLKSLKISVDEAQNNQSPVIFLARKYF